MFEWKILPGHTTLTLLKEVQNMMEKDKSQPESFKGRIIFISMFHDIGCARKATKKVVNAILQVLPNRPKIFLKDIGHASDLDLKQNVVLHSLTNRTVRGTESLDAYIWRKQTPFVSEERVLWPEDL